MGLDLAGLGHGRDAAVACVIAEFIGVQQLLFPATRRLHFALELEGLAFPDGNFFLIHRDRFGVCLLRVFHRDVQRIGTGNVDLFAVYHLVGGDVVLIFLLVVQLFMRRGKGALFKGSKLFKSLRAVAVAPVDLIAVRSLVFQPGERDLFVAAAAFCEKHRELQVIDRFSA